jgi:segregation and condensation protein A
VSDYRVQLDVFTGPLDLLLYLIRRDEVDIYDIPLTRVTEQYLNYLHMLDQLDPNVAGDFLVMAATLLELKSRALLPTPPLGGLDEGEDPRAPLVRQLLEYKRFKDAARSLGTAADERAKRYVRVPADLPKELQGVELEEAQVWDLLAAFTRVMTAIGKGPGEHAVSYQDTPIELYAGEIVALLEQEGPTTFQALFETRTERLELIGWFLALLELIRMHRIRADQEATFGTIYLFLLVEVAEAEDEAEADAEAEEGAESSPEGIEGPRDQGAEPM